MSTFILVGYVISNSGKTVTKNGIDMVKLTMQSGEDEFEVAFFGYSCQPAEDTRNNDLIEITGSIKSRKVNSKNGGSFSNISLVGSKIQKYMSSHNSNPQGQIPLQNSDNDSDIPF